MDSLPAWTYHNEEFFQLEAEQLFRPAWHLVCHLSNIENEGDYFTFEILGESIVVLRHENNIKAFHNVCRHRGARLLDGPSGNVNHQITCPYHAWRYDLNGCLKSVPYQDQFESINLLDHGLKPITIEIFLGFVFINFQSSPATSPATSVAEQFAPVLDELTPYQFENLQPLGRVTLRYRDVNWKQIADNYVDALHIPIAHPGLTSLVGNSYRLEVTGGLHKMSAHIKDMRNQSASARAYRTVLPAMEHLPAEKQQHWFYLRMWPGLAFDIYPEQIDFMQFIPISATQTLIREIPYGLPDNRREVKAARYLNWRINREVNAEDTVLVNRVQQGMTSSSFKAGPLAKTETCLIDSMRKIQQAIPVAKLIDEPAPGTVRKINQTL